MVILISCKTTCFLLCVIKKVKNKNKEIKKNSSLFFNRFVNTILSTKVLNILNWKSNYFTKVNTTTTATSANKNI